MRFLFFFFFFSQCKPLKHVNLLSSGKTVLTLCPLLSEVCSVELSWWGNNLISLGSLAKLCWGVLICPYWVPAYCFPPKGAPTMSAEWQGLSPRLSWLEHYRSVDFICFFSHCCSPEDMVGSAVSSDSSFLFDPSTHPFLHENIFGILN